MHENYLYNKEVKVDNSNAILGNFCCLYDRDGDQLKVA